MKRFWICPHDKAQSFKAKEWQICISQSAPLLPDEWCWRERYGGRTSVRHQALATTGSRWGLWRCLLCMAGTSVTTWYRARQGYEMWMRLCARLKPVWSRDSIGTHLRQELRVHGYKSNGCYSSPSFQATHIPTILTSPPAKWLARRSISWHPWSRWMLEHPCTFRCQHGPTRVQVSILGVSACMRSPSSTLQTWSTHCCRGLHDETPHREWNRTSPLLPVNILPLQ